MMIMWSRPVVTTTGPSENMFYMHTWVPTWSWMFSYYSADMQNYNNFLKLPFSGHPKESAHFLCFSTSSSGAHSIMKYCDWRNGGAWRIYWLILINGLLGPTWKKVKSTKKGRDIKYRHHHHYNNSNIEETMERDIHYHRHPSCRQVH